MGNLKHGLNRNIIFINKDNLIMLSVLIICGGLLGLLSFVLNPIAYTATTFVQVGRNIYTDRWLDDPLIIDSFLSTPTIAQKIATKVGKPELASLFTALRFGGLGGITVREYPKTPYIQIRVSSGDAVTAVDAVNYAVQLIKNEEDKQITEWQTLSESRLTLQQNLLDAIDQTYKEKELAQKDIINSLVKDHELLKQIFLEKSSGLLQAVPRNNYNLQKKRLNKDERSSKKENILSDMKNQLYIDESKMKLQEIFQEHKTQKLRAMIEYNEILQRMKLQNMQKMAVLYPGIIEVSIFSSALKSSFIGSILGLILGLLILTLKLEVKSTSQTII